MRFKFCFKKVRKEAEEIPSWYYGLSHRNWEHCESVYYIMPINYFIRLFKNIDFLWCKFRSRESYVDKQIRKGVVRNMRFLEIIIDQIINEKLEDIKVSNESQTS